MQGDCEDQRDNTRAPALLGAWIETDSAELWQSLPPAAARSPLQRVIGVFLQMCAISAATR